MGKKHSFKGAGIFFAVFIVYTLLVKFVDVAPAGASNTEVGFSTINGLFFKLFSGSDFCYKLTQICGYLSLLAVLAFAALGCFQLIKGKSLKAVDPRIITLGIYFVIVIILYVIFEFVVINCRPVLMDGELEASYPSSHTMLALTVSYAVVMFFNRSKLGRNIKQYITSAAFIFMILVIVGRLVSGVHWFTDIVGAIILSIAVMNLFAPIYDLVQKYMKK